MNFQNLRSLTADYTDLADKTENASNYPPFPRKLRLIDVKPSTV